MAQKSLPAKQISSGVAFDFDLNCTKCQLFIELESSGMYRQSDCFQETQLKFRILYREPKSENWIDVTNSALVTTSKGLTATKVNTLQIVNHENESHFVRAVFMNKEVEVPVIIWSLEETTLESSDYVLNRFGFCQKETTNEFENYPVSTYQYTSIWSVAKYSSSMGKTNRLVNDFELECKNCMIEKANDKKYVTSTAGEELEIGLKCDETVKLILDVSDQPVSISRLENGLVEMSDKSQLPVNVYSRVNLFVYKTVDYPYGQKVLLSTGTNCNSTGMELFHSFETYPLSTTQINYSTVLPKTISYDFVIPALSILLCIFSLSLVYIITKTIQRKKIQQKQRFHHY